MLVDGYDDGDLICRSEFESPEVDGEVRVPVGNLSPEDTVGKFLKVRIKGASDYDLTGEIIE